MKDFSLKEMQREYRGVLRVTAWAFSAVLITASLAGAILISRGADRQVILTAAMLLGIVCLGAAGWFLVLTDRRRLMQKTPFGQAAARMGDTEEILRQIDASAEALFDDRGAFILTEDWLLIRYLSPCRLDPQRVCMAMAKRSSLRAVLTQPEKTGEERILVTVLTVDGGSREFFCYNRQDLDALAAWMRKAQENIRR